MARCIPLDKLPKYTKTVSFNYIAEGLEIGVDEVERFKNIELRNLQSRRKLCLVLDLDHTLLHTKRVVTLSPQQKLDLSCYEDDVNDFYEWELIGEEFFTKLRPFVRQFLEEASEMFELYVYTMGSRDYALHIVREFLDPQGVYFGDRVIAREDCSVQGQKGLDVVPVHESAVLILDDTEYVWKTDSRNLIKISRYDYFKDVSLDETEDQGGLSIALKFLREVHGCYFEEYDRFVDGDVRELMKIHRKRIVKDEGQQKVGKGTCSSDLGVGKRSRVVDECSSHVTKKQRIC